MELFIQTFNKEKIVEIVGWNKNDAILQEYGSNFRFAVCWDIFLKYYKRLETFDCDVSEYEGVDLSNFIE